MYKGKSSCKGLIYCSKQNRYLDYIFVLAYGCDHFEEKYLSLLEEDNK